MPNVKRIFESLIFERPASFLRGLTVDRGVLKLPMYTDATRPDAADVPAGAMIWNSGDAFTNVSDGTDWKDPTGATT